jgi:hypothetical protein
MSVRLTLAHRPQAPTTAKKIKLTAEEKAALALQREQEKER